ncbi:hypothetical protein D3C84_1286600 [compost metagenome]
MAVTAEMDMYPVNNPRANCQAAVHQLLHHVTDLHHAAIDFLGHRALLLGGGGDLGAQAVDRLIRRNIHNSS